MRSALRITVATVSGATCVVHLLTGAKRRLWSSTCGKVCSRALDLAGERDIGAVEPRARDGIHEFDEPGRGGTRPVDQ
jgi:hypothetical protein